MPEPLLIAVFIDQISEGYEKQVASGNKKAVSLYEEWQRSLDRPPTRDYENHVGINDMMLQWVADRMRAARAVLDSEQTAVPDEGEEQTPDGWGNADLLQDMMAAAKE